MEYFRPIPICDVARPEGALPLAGGWSWFSQVELLQRGQAPRILPVADLPAEWRERLTAKRADVVGLSMDAPRLMGILNVTPDSFSDGGRYLDAAHAVGHVLELIGEGAEIIDVGGESTRPGAAFVPEAEEVARILPVVQAVQALAPVSLDTRKAAVAKAGLAAEAAMVNDVSALGHDPAMAGVLAAGDWPVCLMHAQGTPQDMQDDPRYGDVLLDVYDHLAERIAFAEQAGIARGRIIVDPGIGFGKTLAHNLALLERLSLFHGLGCPLLLGVSRKRFIGTIAQEADADRRAPGSVAVALAGVMQGAQILRVHDVGMTRQALRLWQAVTGMGQ
ncbi:dihydropteroate synthase [Neogemmobacter tilapiae]|nr:dihydropteroate synthase [Gemmobacter tilapiae]